jgi:hypothetical protein
MIDKGTGCVVRNAGSWFFAALLLFWCAGQALAAACSSAGSGNWNAPATWAACGGVVPAAADTVTVNAGHVVTLNAAPAGAASSVTVVGTLVVSSNLTVGTNVAVNAGTLQVNAGAVMAVGTTIAHFITLSNSAATLLQVNGGSLTVAGGITSATTASAGTYTQTGGTVTMATVGQNTQDTFVLGSATVFNMSGGTLALQRGNASTNDINIRSATQNVTGGTVQIGGAVAGNPFLITNTGGGSVSIWNLVLLTAGSPSVQLGAATNVLNDVTINTGSTLVENGAFALNVGGGNLGGNWTNNGAFTQSTSTVTFTGTSAAPAIGGTTSTTFNNLVINKGSNDLTVNTSFTVNGTLTFTKGRFITGANVVSLGNAGTIATPSATSYVVGNFRKNYAAAANLSYFAGNNFPVGDATSFTPVNISAGTTTTAGSLTVATFTPDHPQVTTPIASTGIAATQSVNRYWRFTNAGMTVGTALTATFTFVAGDIDPGAVTGSFIVQRYDGTNWNPTTIVAANPLNTQVSNITPLAVGSNDFAIGDPIPGFNGAVGAFNIFETTTPANAILGRIYTKLAYYAGPPPPPTSPATFNLSVVAVNAGRTGVNAAFAASPITVDLLDARDNTGALTAASDCRATWATVISTQSIAVAWGGTGRVNVAITAPANAWRDVRVRVTQGGNVGCSSDRFAIRPTAFTSVTSTMNNSGTSGAPSLKTGQNFTISALAGLTGYDNGVGVTLANPQIIPLIDNTLIVGSPTAGAVGGAFGAASAGTATGAAFYYSEVGNFGLSTNAIYDNVFTAVDQVGVSECTADFSNALVGGMYGCKFGSPAVALAAGFGRFIPDNFDVSLNVPQIATACAGGSFTYTGQTFGYSTAPVLTVTARNGTSNGLANATTTNYAGAYMKITNAILTPNTQAARYARFDALGGGTTPALSTGNVPGAPGVGADPVIGAFASGVGTLTFSAGAGLSFTRGATPSSPFSADIALSINVLDTDGVAFAGNPAAFGAATAGNGVAFTSGKAMRFGRLRLQNAFGPLGNDLPVTLAAEYWNGTTFATNTLDSCLTLVAGNFALGSYIGGISAANMKPGAPAAGNVSVGGAFSNGVGTLRLTKPSPAAATPGGVAICADLDGGVPTDATCVATTPANLPWLKGNWGNATTYIDDPRSRATFGLFGAQPRQFIYLREYY